MSYRTYAEGIQIFGNNEYYPEWFEFIRSQGISVSDECLYEGDIMDFMGAMEAVESVVLRMEREIAELRKGMPSSLAARHPSLFDLSGIYAAAVKPPEPGRCMPRLFDELFDRIEYGYLFMPVMLFHACQDKLEPDPDRMDRFRPYRLKAGEKIHVKGS